LTNEFDQFEEELSLLKSLRRDLIIKKIIWKIYLKENHVR
jgi:hypothetical protein